MRNKFPNQATRKSDLTLKKLEDRILFDATLDPGLDPEAANAQAALSIGNESVQSYEQDVATYHDQSEQAADEEQNSATTVRDELVIVDSSVENYQQLVDDLLHNNQEDRELAVVLLDANADGIEQVSQILAQYNDLDAVHLVSHGDTAAFRLGNAWITTDNLEAYAGQVASWGEALNGSGDLLLYGCNLAESAEGRELVDSLAALTGSDVAASSNDTGSATRGGDWALEYRHGTLESTVVFSQSLQTNYRGVLAVGPDVEFANANQNAQLGETFAFTVTFDNTGTDVGYGPFVDLIFPVNGIDGAAGNDTADGIDFAGATYLGQPLNFIEITFPDDGGGTGTIDHPFAVDVTGNPMQITGTAGDKLVVLELPFGSFSPGQPPADLIVSATTSILADLDSDLIIQSRSGFRYGSDPLDNPTADPSVISDATTDVSNPLTGWSEQLTVTPTLMSLTKTYLGPENETATGPNFPHQYRLDVDIADGQTISNLDITDSLPNNIVITSIDSVLVNGAASPYTDNLSSLTFPGNNLDLTITPTGSVTGTASTANVSVTFSFYVAEFDADGNRIISLTGEDDLAASESWNNARAVGDWTPIDSRDAGGTNNAVADPDSTGPEHILDDKAIAIQKSVAIVSNAGVAGASPGDVLEYTLQFQISDYYTFGDLIIDDVFQDGQLFDFTYGATFDVSDKNGNVTGSFTVRQVSDPDGGETLVVDQTQINYADNGTEDGVTPDGSDGSTTLRFDLSQALVDNLATDGVLQGGLSDGGTNQGAAVGTIRFRTIIQEDYADTFPSGDRSVDHGDAITNNSLTISGTVRENSEEGGGTGDITTVIGTESDTSSAGVVIVGGTLAKEVYAINGSTILPIGDTGRVTLTPGDTVTYRIEYVLPTSDVEDLSFTDYLPLPIFDVDDHNADGTGGDSWIFDSDATFDAVAGTIEIGSNDTFFALSGITPTITVDTGSNGLIIDYGDFDDPASQQSTIELFVTVTAQDAPTADGLFLTNIVRASEGTTGNQTTSQDQIVQIEVLQPVLSITKGVVTTSESGAVYTGTGVGPVTFEDPGSVNPSFTTGFTSSDLMTSPIDSDVSGLDAGDLVKFAIVIENTGGADAFDLTISDILAVGFEIPTGATGLNLEVRDGNGTMLIWTGVDTGAANDLFAGGIIISDPVGEGAINNFDDATTLNDGSNIIVVTYDLELKDSVTANQSHTNTASLTNFAGQDNGVDYTSVDLTDDANVTTKNHDATKSIVSTSEDHTTAIGGIDRVTIGEIIRYRVSVALPEGTFSDLQIRDVLPGGLTFIDDGTALVAFVSDSGSITSTTLAAAGLTAVGNETNVATITPTWQLPDDATSINISNHNDNYTTGQDVYFKLGDVANNENDANLEYVVLEFNVLVDNNSTGSQNDVGESRYNDIRVYQNGSQVYDMPDANRPRIIIAEPLVQNINKTADITNGDAGDTVTYTVTFDVATGDNRSDAFDVRLYDSLPTGLNFGSITSILVDGAATTFTNSSAGNILDVVIDRVDKGQSVEVVYDATLDIGVNPNEMLTNDAQVTWSSLPGQFGTADGTGGNNTGSDLDSLNGLDTNDGNGETASIIYDTSKGLNHGERDGSDGAGGNPNDYADNDTHTVTVDGISVFSKSLVSTELDDAFNGLNDVVVGEIATYEITITFPEGTTPNSVIVDTMDNGLAFVGMVSSSLNDVNITGSTTPTVSGDGRVLTFDFGTVTDADLSNDTGGTITLRYEAIVLNVAGNQSGTTLDNSAEFTFNGNPATSINTDASDIIVREAHVEVTKTAEVNPPSGSTSGDAGDPVRYTIVMENTSGYDAFDITFSDTLPTVSGGTSAILGATFSVVDSMGVLTSADFTLSGNDATGYTLSLNGGVDLDLLKSDGARTITITVDGTIAPTNGPNDVLINNANAQWTSLDNVVGNRSTHTTDDSGERDGTNAADNTHDYTDTGTAAFFINAPVFNKSLFSTDQTETSGSDVTIGEHVTFALLVSLPEGTTAGLVVTDLLPTGLNYESFQLVTTTAGSGGLLTADFNGTILGTDPVVTGGTADGDDVTFTFGQINVALDNVTDNNAFLILVTASVSDVATNVGYAPGQTTLANTATIDVVGDAIGPTTSNQIDVDVVESNLVVTKDIDKTKADASETVSITLTIENTGLGDAFDVNLQDTLVAADYDLSTVSLGIAGTDYPADFVASFNSGTGLLEYNGGQIAAGATISVTFTADLTTTVAPGATLTNTATITNASTLDGVVAGERDNPDPDGDGSDTASDTIDIRTNSISGNVYFDADNDGTFDGSESGIAAVDVRLQGIDHLGDAVDITIATLPDGSYTFDDLRPGTYSVTETQPLVAPSGNDYLDGTDTIGTAGGTTANDLFSNILLATGTETDSTDNNFGELEEAELSGFVWHDADNDGVKDPSELGIGGVTVTLNGTDDQGVITPVSVTSNPDGSFTFDGLRPGEYTITETQPAFTAPSGRDYADGQDLDGSLANGDTSTNDSISSINVAAGNGGVDYNFAEVVESVVSGFVYHDQNNDGSRAAETGIENVTVTLTGIDDLGNPLNLTTTTDVNGYYQFANLRPSNGVGYTLAQTQPGTHLDGIDTIGTPGGNDTANDVFSSITVTSDTSGTENNFGELLPSSLNGIVFNDHDNDGIQDAGEAGIGGVQINLTGIDDLGNAVNQTVFTNPAGTYSFTNLRPSDIAGYTLTETQPVNFNDGIDSDGSLANGDATIDDQVSSIDVVSGDGGTGYNFAEQGVSIDGTVFVDDNRDGTLDVSEPTRIAGVVIELYDAAGTTLIASTTTAPDGTYSFDNLPADDYVIRQIHPGQFSSTSADTLNVTLPLTGLTDQNFGEALWDLGDYLWFDADNDGLQDAGEAGLANVGITLLYAGTDGNFATTGDNTTIATTTDTNGFYSFSALFNGEYQVTVDPADLPSGVTGTFETDDSSIGIDGTSNITIGGSDRFDVDFGYRGSGAIGDFVFLDVDGDGVQDPEDNGLANVTVNVVFAGADGLFGNDDDLTFTTATDANGIYSFNNMPGGDFRVAVDTADPDLPGNISGVSGPQSNSGTVNLTLADGETNNDIDYGFAGTLTLGDRLWFDGNGDGFQDVLNEPGFANVELTLDYAGQDGIFGTVDDVSLTDTTDANGNYTFNNLADGEYRIAYNPADLPAGMTGTHEVDDSAAAIDGIANITLNGSSRNEVDFGFRGAGSVGDFVFLDVNGDGVQDASEPGLANITVDLEFAGTDGLFGTGDDFGLQTTTDGNGVYGFYNLADGNYRIVVDVVDVDMPGSLTPVAGAESISGTANVTLDTINGRSHSDLDFGFAGTNNVGDFVWLDANGNGNQDVDEPGFGNVDVTLTYAGQDGIFGNGDDVSLTTITDANGGYNFGQLPDGDYRVALDTGDLPTGMFLTAETNDGVDTLPHTAEFSIGGTDRDDIDFGYTGALTIGDTIYYDVNADGNQGVGEPGIANVDVTLRFAGTDGVFGNADDFVLTTTTDASGTYSFANLPEGEYELTLDGSDLPSGMNVITEEHDDTGAANDGTATVSLSTAGGDNNNVDFGFSGSQNLGDFVWFDVDGNGVQNAGEPGLGDVQVTLLFAGQDGTFGTPDDVSVQTTTDSNGAYSFINLADGNYQVSINNSDLPTGMNQTAETDDGPNGIAGTAEVSISGANRTDIDFGYLGSGSISDFAWYDANGNGSQDIGEPGLPNASVQLTSAGENGIFGDADDFILNTTTDQNGLYSFDNLPASDYRVDLTGEPGGMTQTAETDDGANAIPGVAEVQLAVGEIQDNVDFGFIGTGSIGDTIFFDQDGNGVQDASEIGFPNVTVELQIDFDNDGTFDHTITTLTDANGNYLFGNLPASDYIVTVTQPDGTNQTADPDVTMDNVATLTLADGENNVSQNFGYQGTGSIGDTVFWDQDADGIHDASEIGMSGVAVDLDIDLNSDGIVDHTLSTTTDANGQYSFGDLPAGSYTVRVTQPAGTTPTSDADGLGSTNQSTHNLTAGENNIDQNFGYRGNGSIGDTIFFDYLGDGGPLNPGENDRGIAGVDVTLEIDVDGDGSTDVTRVETTDTDGNFSFDNLIDGDYTITVDSGDLPDAMGANPTFNFDGTIDSTTDVILAVNEVNNEIDFGYHATPDYTITKDDGLSDVVPGQTITYTISLTNNGTHRGQNVVVVDSYPTSILENVAATVNGVPGGIVDPLAGTVSWNLASVGMGEIVTLTVTADVIDPLASGITGLSNDVNVGDDGFNGVDPNPGDNFDDDVDTVTAQPDYQMIKSNDLSGPAVPGQTFNYFLQVVNSGDQDGTGVVVTDTLPIHILDSFSVVTDDPANVIYDPVTGDLVWNVGSLAGGGGAQTLMVTVTVQDPVSTLMASFNNTAYVSDDGANGADPNMADNSSTNSAGLNATPDYQIVKASSLTDTAFVGDTFEYTITVTNIGDQDGTGVTVKDFLPVGVIDRFDVTTDDPANVTYSSATGELNWDVGALNGRGGTSTLTISVSIPFVVEDILADEIVNSATVADDGLNGLDPDLSNNISTVTDPFLAFAFDSFNNFSKPLDRNQDNVFGQERGEHARLLRPIPIDPIFSGLAEPGTTLSLKIYDEEGNIIGERQVVADASGNWLANFPNTIIWKDPHRMDVEQTAPIQGSVDEIDGFNMRRYFHPATHHSLYFTERDTVSTVMRNTAYETIESMHAANHAPLQVGWRNHLYQLNVSSTNVSSK